MPPFAAACPWTEEDAETRLQEAQLSDWLAQADAFASKTRDGAEAAVFLKVL